MLRLPDIAIDGSTKETLVQGAYKILEFIRPSWKSSDVHVKFYTDGITNKLIGVWNELCSSDQILIRVYGEKTELFIDRKKETENMEILYEHGCGPRLYAVFKNGLSYAFIHGTPVTTTTIREEHIWRAVGKHMAEFHKIETKSADSKESFLFPKIKRLVNLLPDVFEKDQQLRLEAAGINREYIEAEVECMEAVLTALSCPLVFSHNDILLNNVIWNKEEGKAHFIDFEYGAVNYQPYDVANHFAEFAGVDNVDYDLYPDAPFQRKWIRNYLSSYFNLNEDEISSDTVEKWRVLVNKFTLASHIFWGVWALVQVCNSTIDFEFLGYGLKRLAEYKRRKEEFLAL